jgi:nucleoside-diphosphate-sugar epimerase
VTGTTVLITGAAGRVGTQIVPHLRNRCQLRLADARGPAGPAGPAAQDADVLVGDLLSPTFAADAVAGVDAVIHLAGVPSPRGAWPTLEPANIRMTQQVLEASRTAGVRRVVFASSIHAAGAYVRDGKTPVDPSWPPHPCCLYGASKVAAEAVGQVYADKYRLPVACIRVGTAVSRPIRPFDLTSWVSPRDLAEIFSLAIDGGPAFGIYFGVSANTRGQWLIDNARANLGYQPVDDAERFASEVDNGVDVPLCFRPHQQR